ncbi:MAG: exosortase family protein XrtM [Gammaproteobacteria bacterium]|nr:exosortase family protein XrtM [Gammaproteobacteria bacterium]
MTLNPTNARTALRFTLGMLLLYGLFYWAYFCVPDETLRNTLYLQDFVRPSTILVNFLSPGEHASAMANRLVSLRAVLEIVRGCDGSGALFLLSAAILAFPATGRMKLRGIAVGAVAVYALNLLRLAGLYFIAAYKPALFLPLHIYFVPTLLIIVVCLIFIAWTALASAGRDGATLTA